MKRRFRAQGADFIATPEITNLIESDSGALHAKTRRQEDDESLKRFSELARELECWLLIGSLALKTPGEKLVNRSFLLSPGGDIAAHYDKIHLFDVQLAPDRVFHESKNYAAGDRLVLADTGFARIGLSICYDLRFPQLYRALAQAGAQVLTVPSAFTRITGEAHWHVLLRARAIECGAFIIAPAQCGRHSQTR